MGGAAEGCVNPKCQVEVCAHRDSDLRRRAVRAFSKFQIGHGDSASALAGAQYDAPTDDGLEWPAGTDSDG